MLFSVKLRACIDHLNLPRGRFKLILKATCVIIKKAIYFYLASCYLK